MSTLVLLPGLDGTGTLFDTLIQELPAGIESRVVAYPRDRCLDYSALETVVRAALPTDRPFTLLAESFSGPLAIRMGAARAAGLAGIVLSCSFARSPYPLSRLAAGLVRSASPTLVPSDWRAALVLGSDSRGPVRARIDQAVASVAHEVLAHRAASVLEVDDTALLSLLEIPVLYLRASNDHLIPGTAGEWIRQHVKHVDLVEIEGPHMLLQARAASSARAISAWMCGHGFFRSG